MLRTSISAWVASSVVLTWGLSVEAQTIGRTSTRQTNPAFGASAPRTTAGTLSQFGPANTAAAIGSGISHGVQSFSAGVPALQQAQELRDTALRGQFVGAEARNAQQAFGGGRAASAQQTGTGPNLRIGPVRQPRAQAGQASPYGRQAGTSLQPTLTLGFSPTMPSSADVQRNVAEAVMRAPSIRDGTSIAVRAEAGGVVVLEGAVGSAHQRALASQLVALEPGVTKVDNRLTVLPAEPNAR